MFKYIDCLSYSVTLTKKGPKTWVQGKTALENRHRTVAYRRSEFNELLLSTFVLLATRWRGGLCTAHPSRRAIARLCVITTNRSGALACSPPPQLSHICKAHPRLRYTPVLLTDSRAGAFLSLARKSGEMFAHGSVLT